MVAATALMLVVGFPSRASAQYRPAGRRHPAHGSDVRSSHTRAPRTSDRARTSTGTATKVTPNGTRPTSSADLEHLLSIAIAQPTARGPIAKAIEIARREDGNVAGLVEELRRRAESHPQLAASIYLVLSNLHAIDNDRESAWQDVQRALVLSHQSSEALEGAANLAAEFNDRKAAIGYWERLIPKLETNSQRERAWRTVRDLALDESDWARADVAQAKLVELAHGSFYVQAELGRELLRRNQPQRAAQALKALIGKVRGDPRALAPALRDLGEAMMRSGEYDQAQRVLSRAASTAARMPGLLNDIDRLRVEAARHDGKLTELLKNLEHEHHRNPERLLLLGELNEELGHLDRATRYYRETVRGAPRNVDARSALIRVLQLQGRMQESLRQLEELSRQFPERLEYALQLVDLLIQQGKNDRARDVLARLQRASAGDPNAAPSLAEAWERLGDSGRALEVLQRAVDGGDTSKETIVELGRRLAQQGKRNAAARVWRRLVKLAPSRPAGLLRLADLLVSHDMVDEALRSIDEARRLAPNDPQVARSSALTLERAASATGHTRARALRAQAAAIWQGLLDRNSSGDALETECIHHLALLWTLDGKLAASSRMLAERLSANPSNSNLARLLAESQRRLGRRDAAENTLRALLRRRPRDVSAFEDLERLLVSRSDYLQAADVVRKLLVLRTEGHAQLFRRLIEYSVRGGQQGAAEQFARKAIDLSPDDPEPQLQLARILAKEQKGDQATTYYRRALALDPQRQDVRLEMAELLISLDRAKPAFNALSQVVRFGTDDEVVARAARAAIRLDSYSDQAHGLEQELLAATLRHPDRPVYRDLLLELYGAMTYPWVLRSHSPNPSVARQARDRLRQIGRGAVAPLLAALTGGNATQQRVALELLSQVHNESAGPALLTFAESGAPVGLRVRAVIAAGLPANRELLSRLVAITGLETQNADGSDPVAVAAAWAVARLDGDAARRSLHDLLGTGAPEIQGWAALSLGLHRDRSAVGPLRRIANDPAQGAIARAAALLALDRLDAPPGAPMLAELSRGSNPLLAKAALCVVADARSNENAQVLADALAAVDRPSDLGLLQAAARWSGARPREWGALLSDPDLARNLPAVLTQLAGSEATPKDLAELLIGIAPALADATRRVAQTNEAAALSIGRRLLAQAPRAGYGALTASLDSLETAISERAEAAARSILEANRSGFKVLLEHRSPSVRSLAYRVLALDGASVEQLVGQALADSSPQVRATGLAVFEQTRPAGAVGAVVTCLRGDPDWSVRATAATALGGAEPVQGGADVDEALSNAVRGDVYALVRAAALKSLVARKGLAAVPELRYVETHDPEEEIVNLARTLQERSP